ncbi:hypothetical protein G3O08_13280 [Cryomorpha ignava]|uniref:DUF2029 domain-containing protein n=1 Tax=Cryomorpha ignava TaxID=101383 RepID=A0A7K3WS30_9FLAO|nr:hypothetical protein [Cryomorpha ignava]NEN24477.1 hypothetical protein [Cryomorpha ignava]
MKLERSKLALILAPIYILGFIALTGVERSNFSLLLTVYSALFVIYFVAVKYKLRYGLFAAILLFAGTRIPFFFDLPQLSDDFYRFIWDGMLLNEGLNPIGRVPSAQHIYDFKDTAFAELLLGKMNSPDYSSVYPTFHQLFFGLAYFFSGRDLLANVNVMRAFIVIFEFTFFLVLLVRGQNKEQNFVYGYLLNPLIVMEGVGNVHFEAVMLPWIAIALIDFSSTRYLRVAVTWTSGILVKLTPAILGPMLLFRMEPKSRFYFIMSSLFILFVFLGMLQPWTLFTDLSNGLGLYFGSFEFNASIYYLLREILTPLVGYNPISFLAPLLAFIAFGLIVAVSWYRRKSNIFELALVVFLIYLLFSTTVHPWYIIPVVYLAIRSGREYILIWSFTAILSYTHYMGELGPKWVYLSVEYCLLGLAIFMESKRKRWLQPKLRG